MNRQIIVLEVTYDPQTDGFTDKVAPSEWDWPELIGWEDEVRVIAAGPVEVSA